MSVREKNEVDRLEFLYAKCRRVQSLRPDRRQTKKIDPDTLGEYRGGDDPTAEQVDQDSGMANPCCRDCSVPAIGIVMVPSHSHVTATKKTEPARGSGTCVICQYSHRCQYANTQRTQKFSS